MNSFQYFINADFHVSETHQTAIYDLNYTIIESRDVHDYHYYCESPSKRIADCNICHDSRINESKKKLLFNVININ